MTLNQLSINLFSFMLLTELSEGCGHSSVLPHAPLPNMKKLRDGLLVFFYHYLGSEEETQENSVLLERLRLVESLWDLSHFFSDDTIH